MRSGANARHGNHTATGGVSGESDFVQNYAEKRAAQMERARQIREERLRAGGASGPPPPQQPPSVVSAPSLSYEPPGSSGVARGSAGGADLAWLSSPQQQAGGRVPVAGQSSSNSSGGGGARASKGGQVSDTVISVVEDDFRVASQRGIITLDQARQLWAVLSDQALSISAGNPQRGSGGRGAGAKHNEASEDDYNSARNPRGAGLAGSLRGGAAGPSSNGSTISSAGSNASISMASLKASIAKFKKQQQLQQQQSLGVSSMQGPKSRVTNTHSAYVEETEEAVQDSYALAAQIFSTSVRDPGERKPVPSGGAGSDRRAGGGRPANANTLRYGHDDETAMEEEQTDADFWSRDVKGPPPPRGKNQPPQRTGAGKATTAAASGTGRRGVEARRPMWNSDVTPATTSDGADTSSDPWGSGGTDAVVNGGARAGAKPVRAAPRGPAWVSSGGSPAPAMNFDDIPVGGGGGGGGFPASMTAMNAPPTQSAPAPRKSSAQATAKKSVAPSKAPRGMSMDYMPSSNHGAADVDWMPVGAGAGGGDFGQPLSSTDVIAQEAAAAASEPQLECPHCERCFRASILPRHQKLCLKQQNSKRKVFDVTAQRLDGIEGINEIPRPSIDKAKKGAAAAPKGSTGVAKMPKWKIQHEQFQAAMKAVRAAESGSGGGGGGGGEFGGGGFGGETTGLGFGKGAGKLPPPPPPMPAEYDDRVPCPHCGRKFADLVAERHIPKCQSINAKPTGIRPWKKK